MNEHDPVFCLLTLKQDLPQKHSFMSCFRQLVWKKSFTNSSVNYFSALTFFVKWHLTKQMSVNLFFSFFFTFLFSFAFTFWLLLFLDKNTQSNNQIQGEEIQYIIPSMLPFEEGSFDDFFGDKTHRAQIRLFDCSNEPLLPRGLFYRVVCKSIRWSQFTSKSENSCSEMICTWVLVFFAFALFCCFVLSFSSFWSDLFPCSIFLFSQIFTEFVLDQILFKWKWTQQTNSFPFSPIPNSQQTLFVWWVFFCTFYSCINLSFSKNTTTTNFKPDWVVCETSQNWNIQKYQACNWSSHKSWSKTTCIWIGWTFGWTGQQSTFLCFNLWNSHKKTKENSWRFGVWYVCVGCCILVVLCFGCFGCFVFWLFCVLVVLCFGCFVFSQ